MKVEVRIVAGQKEPRVVILTDEVTPEVSELIKRLSDESAESTKMLLGYKDGKVHLLSPDQVVLIFAEQQKVFAKAASETFELRQRLYELEEKLPRSFLRISNSEIVNFDKVKSLDMSMAGTISLKLITGGSSFVSRRYVGKIKRFLGI